MNKTLKTYKKLVESYGLTFEHGTKHYIVSKDGKRVGTVAGTGEQNALRQSLRDLRRGGYVDDQACRVKF